MIGRAPRAIYVSPNRLIDLDRREMRVDGVPVSLGSRAFDILEVLIDAGGELVSKAEIIDRVWPGAVVEENALQFHISAIRKAFGAERGLLKTVSGRGYRFVGAQFARSGTTVVGSERPAAGNLRAVASEMVGRSSNLKHLMNLASIHRVLNLSGPGGIGKSKLALELAHSLAWRFPGGAWWVELVSVTKPERVPSAVAEALGLKLTGGGISTEAIALAIGDRRLLLVLDNCEHLVEAVAQLAEVLVTHCPYVLVIATSREALRVEGEYTYRVPSLDAPPARENEPGSIQDYSAVQLFIARTRALDDGFAPDERSLSTIAAICRHLDGIPLAIEFAAARAATLGVEEVAARLGDRFSLLISGNRTALPRHKTLRAALDVSYELLPDSEQRLLRRLAVFPAGFTLEAAIAVAGDVTAESSAVVDGVASLVAKSLVMFEGPIPAARWRLLETIRTYALEKLVASGEAESSARRHADHLLSLGGVDMAQRVRELDNIRAAIDWAFSPAGDVAVGVALTAACGPVWLHLSLMAECRDRCLAALRAMETGPGRDPRIRMQLTLALGLSLSYATGAVDQAWEALSESLQIAEQLDDLDMQLRTIWIMWSHRLNRCEHNATRKLAERYSAVARRAGSARDILVGDRLLGTAFHYEGRQGEARRHLQRFLDLYVAGKDERQRMWVDVDQRLFARSYLARVALLQGFADQAKQQSRLALAEAEAAGHGLSLCFCLGEVAIPIAILTGDLDAASRSISALAAISIRQGASYWACYGPCLQAVLLIRCGKFLEGTELLSGSLQSFRGTGQTIDYVALLGTFAEGLAGAGRFADAQATNEAALVESRQEGQGWYLPELLRIKGELLLRDSNNHAAAAEACFLESIETARRQDALFWEFRSSLSLARLRLRENRVEQASRILAPLYGQFTEGFDTQDLRSAGALLESLQSPTSLAPERAGRRNSDWL